MEDYGSDFESDDSNGYTEEHGAEDNGHVSHTVEGTTSQSSSHAEAAGEEQEYSGSDDSEGQYCYSDGERAASEVVSGTAGSEDGAASSGTRGRAAAIGSAAHHPALRPTRRRLQMYLLKARRAYSRRLGGRAVAQFVRALALARLVHGERHWRALRCQVLLARAYLDLQEMPAQAEEHASEALTALLMYQGTDLVPDGKPQVLHVQLLARLVRGQALVLLQCAAAAEECLAPAARLLDTYSRLPRRPADVQPLQLRLYTALGGAGAARGRLQAAREQLTAALQLLPAESARSRPARVRLLRQLAQLELRGARRQHAQQAVTCLQEAAQLAAQCWGEASAEHLEAEVAVCSAQCRLAEGDRASLAAALSELRRRCVTMLGAAHGVTTAAADLLIQVQTEQEYYEKAIRTCRDNTRAKVELHGELSRPVLDSLRCLSQLYVSSDQPDRALEVGRRRWAMEALMYGQQDKRVQASKTALQEMESRLGGGATGYRSSVSTATPSIDGTLRL